jgi:GTP-binding protein EngB required for normal cell division
LVANGPYLKGRRLQMLTTGRAGVLAALDSLDPLSDGQDRETLTALRSRLETARLRVLLAGEAKRGKSTLINALLGREVLPTGVTPLTAVVTTVTQGAAEDIEVTFTDAATGSFPLAVLADYGTERGNPRNCRHVAAITVRLDAEILRRGVELVDTPGPGSVHAHNTEAADLALPTMDAAIFVLAADPPVSAAERDLLSRVADLSVALFVLLNKADYLDEAGLAEALEFTTEVGSQAAGRPVRVYPMSARAALGGDSDPGFAAFAADFLTYLNTSRARDLEIAVAGHVRRVAQLMLDEAALAERAAQLPRAIAAQRVTAFGARLAAVADHCSDAADRVAAQSRRLLEELTAAAGDERARLTDDLGTRLARVLDRELAAASPADIEQQGRARLTQLITEAVEGWRHEQARQVEAILRRLATRLTAELEAELAAVREAATDLLGLDLALPMPGPRLEPDLRFFYDFDEYVDQAELLAGAFRRRVPGEVGRRLARQRLLRLAPELTDRQIGRARGDLQYRLSEATRHLVADVRERHNSSTERLAAALERAALIRAQTASGDERELAELAGRERALREVISQLP